MKLRALTVCGVSAALLAGAGSAAASAVALRPYVAMDLGYTISDSSRRSDDGVGGYLGGGFPLNKYFNVELGGGYTHFNNDNSKAGSQPWKEFLQEVGFQFFFSRDPSFAPFFSVNTGHITETLTHGGGKDDSWFTDVGLGAIHYFKLFDVDFGLRASAAYRYIPIEADRFPGAGVDKHLGEPVFKLGLLIPIGGGTVTKEEPLPKAVLTPVAPSKPVPGPDANHRFDDIHFAFDQSTLDAYAKASLDSDATTINQLGSKYPGLRVDIAGHTDWIGTDAYNQALSERRANAVEEYLGGKGVKPSSMQIHAYGESKPVAPNTTKAGRALNRRVELKTLAP